MRCYRKQNNYITAKLLLYTYKAECHISLQKACSIKQKCYENKENDEQVKFPSNL